jgi:L-ascorbate metabolism protein UlaG (beta-lactamase superfamily)
MNENIFVKVTRIAHCCVLVDFGGSAILTDPFSEKLGYYRGEPLGLNIADLPPLAAVVVSHDHYDHNDMTAFGSYPDKTVPLFVERGAAQRARRVGFSNVRALAPFETGSVGPVSITGVPVQHGIPEVGFILQALGLTVYFAGDTLLIPALSDIAQRFPKIDVALLPVNGLRVFGKQVVMNPLEAAQLCALLNPRLAIPTHYTFRGGPIVDRIALKYFDDQQSLPTFFKNAVEKYAPKTMVRILPTGETTALEPEPHRRRCSCEVSPTRCELFAPKCLIHGVSADSYGSVHAITKMHEPTRPCSRGRVQGSSTA